MTVKNLCSLVGSDDTPIVLIGKVCWLGTFPCMLLPKCYEDYTILSIMPGEDKGLCCEDMCLKVWVDDSNE